MKLRTSLIPAVVLAVPLVALADDAVQVTFGPADDRHPTWSPDGSQIAYHSADGIYTATTSGRQPDMEFSGPTRSQVGSSPEKPGRFQVQAAVEASTIDRRKS